MLSQYIIASKFRRESQSSSILDDPSIESFVNVQQTSIIIVTHQSTIHDPSSIARVNTLSRTCLHESRAGQLFPVSIDPPTTSLMALQPVREEESFKPGDAVDIGLKGGAVGALAGAFLSGAQNALARQNYGFWGVFTRSGGAIVMFGTIQFEQVEMQQQPTTRMKQKKEKHKANSSREHHDRRRWRNIHIRYRSFCKLARKTGCLESYDRWFPRWSSTWNER